VDLFHKFGDFLKNELVRVFIFLFLGEHPHVLLNDFHRVPQLGQFRLRLFFGVVGLPTNQIYFHVLFSKMFFYNVYVQ